MKMYFVKTFSGILPAALLSVPFGLLFNKLIDCNSYLDFAIEAILYIIVYIALMLLIGFNKQEKKNIFGKFIKTR